MRDTIDMAREAGLIGNPLSYAEWYPEALKAFEALVRADEREACARICEVFADVDSGPKGIMQDYHAYLIRARGNT